ncbi:MAG: hypothetical protein BWY27_00137 [Bacteroidetes bacterium ADurb.Bin234]|jgi:hypothetical protein|nr:MAG: hypothetical protein BWY27_00137 [Bacteroidetes bacterium ADurb.Bin234]
MLFLHQKINSQHFNLLIENESDQKFGVGNSFNETI